MHPSARGRRSSTRACRARRRRRGRAPAPSGRRPSTARRSSRARRARTRRASSATARAGRGSAPAALPPTCRRARAPRPRRAGRTRGWSSATTCRGRAPAPRPTVPASNSSRDGAFIVSQISPGGSRWSPEECASIRPRVGACALSGRCFVSGSSSESSPASRSWRIPTAVNVFVIDPIRYCVCGVASCPASTSASPSARSHSTSPSRKTAALTDGIRSSAWAAASRLRGPR